MACSPCCLLMQPHVQQQPQQMNTQVAAHQLFRLMGLQRQQQQQLEEQVARCHLSTLMGLQQPHQQHQQQQQ